VSAHTIAVVGAGNMGSGIGQKIAVEGLDVWLIDVDEERVTRGLTSIERTLAEGVERGVMSAKKAAAARARVHGTSRLEDAAGADLVIEAVFEDLALKQDVFRRLDAVCRPDTILATNTSSFLVRDIASAVQHPARVLGLHYFYHPAKNHLVEVIAGSATDREVVRRTWALQEQIRKIPIASRDAYGFVVNRFFVVWLMEAIRILQEGLANEATIDAIAKETFGVGMGPFELMNVSGIPIALHASTTIGRGFGPMYGPPARLREQHESGALWSLAGAAGMRRRDEIADRLVAGTCLAAAALVEEGIGTREDTDLGARVGLRWPFGPFELMNRRGIARSLALVSQIASKWALPVPASLVDAGRANTPFALALVRVNGPSMSAAAGPAGPHVGGATATDSSRIARSGIATITIDRPDTMNALNEAVADQLSDAFRKAATDRLTSGLVIAGAGRSFVAGADIRFFLDHIKANDLDGIAQFTKRAQALLTDIDTCPKPVVARLHGVALGGGVELALACDYIVAAPGTSLGFPETGIGIYPGLGGTQRTTRRIGRGLTKWLVLTGKIIAAEEALAIGLIDRVVSHEDLDATAAELIALGVPPSRTPSPVPASHAALAAFFEAHDVDEIRLGRAATNGDATLERAMKAVGSNAPIALRIAADLIDRGATVSLAEGLQLELAHLGEIFATHDTLIGLSSIGKSRPVFEGR
jgi:enoyl-CoA hydratase/3-hydroxyacyl-CoA dehydrogenase